MAHHEWDWTIVADIFLGGMGAGCMVLSAAAHLMRKSSYAGIARAGAIAAPVLAAVGSGLVVIHLGKPLRFWRLFAHLNPVSPMSIGSWLMAIFTVVAGLYAILQLPSSWLRAAGKRLRPLAGILEMIARWNETSASEVITYPSCPPAVARLRSFLAVIGIPLGLALGIYTGVLLGAIPARPFWNTPMVAQLFLVSALSTAAALILLLAPLMRRTASEHGEREYGVLLRTYLLFLVLEVFIIIPFIIHGELSTLSAREALRMILGGPYTGVFWIGAVSFGVLVPMVLGFADLLGALRPLPRSLAAAMRFTVPVLILVGGYLLRWVFVHAGQDTHFL
jgi:formate-dependent nitrite reductase membrane component NrfD